MAEGLSADAAEARSLAPFPLLALLIGLIVGVALLQQQSALISSAHAMLLLLACVVGLVAINRARVRRVDLRFSKIISSSIVVFCAAGIGFSYATLRAAHRLSEQLDRALEGEVLSIVGVIDSLPQRDEDGARFAFAVERVESPDSARLPSKLALSWYAGQSANDDVPDVRPGERWRLQVRLKRPHGFVNPHGFDIEAWLLERNLRATGSVLASTSASNQRLARDAGRILDRVDVWRARVRERMRTALADARWGGVLIALGIGDQQSISSPDWALFNVGGISHLLSISGSHVTLFAALIYAIALRVWRGQQLLSQRVPAKKVAALLAFVAAGMYATLCGFAVPAQRTFYMIAGATLALWVSTNASGIALLAWAAVAVLIIDPWAILSAGFWFSFAAVAVLLALTAHRAGKPSAWQIAIATQLAITLALAPVSIALFQQVSLVGIVANAIAIPLISFVVVPLTLLWLIIPIDALLHLAHAAFAVLAETLQWATRLPGATWQQHAPPSWAVFAALLGATILVMPRALPGKAFGALLFLPMLFALPPRPVPGSFSLTALDVGQGQAMVVRTHTFDLLYDAGPRWTDDLNAGQRIVLPYLRATGARRGAMIISHQDSDHSGGAADVLHERELDWWMSSLTDPTRVAPRHPRAPIHVRCEAGQTWTGDGVTFRVLHPHRDAYADVQRKTNDLSCVLRVDGANGSSALLVGDIEARAESEMLTRGENLRVQILSVPHHGSRTSSSEAFIAAVSPQVVVVNAGYRNRFTHPRADVLARYDSSMTRIDRTDWHGAVTYTFMNGRWRGELARDTQQRYWTDRPEAVTTPLPE